MATLHCFATSMDFGARTLGILYEFIYAIELHLVIDRSMRHTLFHPIPDPGLLRGSGETFVQ